jgi:hypothetical protein
VQKSVSLASRVESSLFPMRLIQIDLQSHLFLFPLSFSQEGGDIVRAKVPALLLCQQIQGLSSTVQPYYYRGVLCILNTHTTLHHLK